MAHYTPDDIAAGIIAAGETLGVTEKGICIAISTGLVETNLTMYANHADPESLTYPHDAIGSDENSVGVFQQRDPWWGTCYDRMHVPESSGLFFDALVNLTDDDGNPLDYNSDDHTPGWYAAEVQDCAEQYRYRYDERYPEACDIYARLKGQPTEGYPLVGETVLAYDHDIVPQETGYWCGPASAQVCLNIRGIHVPESQLAAECGTDEGGTDYVALIERCLDPRLPEANYTSVDAPHDPPTADEKERLWDGLKRSIDNGYGVVMNWVAPPSNYPVGVKGSASPAYGGGTVYHYVTAAGYDDEYPGRAVWIADSGWAPWGYWCTFDQVASLIPPKALCYANLPHAAAPGAEPDQPDYVPLSYEQLCGPIDKATGYGTGWPQLGTNEAGQNLYVVDALSDILHALENGNPSDHPRSHVATRGEPPDYVQLTYEQLAGPLTADGYGHGWPQLGGRSVTDALAHIKTTLSGPATNGAPPWRPPGGGATGRPAILTFAGTWAAPGTGYPSDVAHLCAEIADEIPVQSPNSFGPVPPGDLRAPSYQESVRISVDWAVAWTLEHTDRPVIAGGYSQGGEAASRYRQEFEPGGRLAHLRGNWVCGFAFGNPSRHAETTFYNGPPTPFDGIADWRLPALGWDWCELVDPGDLYGTSARGLTGEIERDVYTLCTEMELHSGAAEFAKTLVANLIEVVRNLDGDAYDDMQRALDRHGVDLAGATLLPPAKFAGLRDGLLSVQGIAAAIAAAVDALIFFCTSPPTAAHIQYEVREVWPGMTYVGLAVQHVHDWLSTYAEIPTLEVAP